MAYNGNSFVQTPPATFILTISDNCPTHLRSDYNGVQFGKFLIFLKGLLSKANVSHLKDNNFKIDFPYSPKDATLADNLKPIRNFCKWTRIGSNLTPEEAVVFLDLFAEMPADESDGSDSEDDAPRKRKHARSKKSKRSL